MSIPINMRVRDWFASRFKSVQFAVPRRAAPAAKVDPVELAIEVLKPILAAALAIMIVIGTMARRHRGRRNGGAPIEAIALGVLLMFLATATFSFLI